MIASLTASLGLLIASLCCAMRHIYFSPQADTFPAVGKWMRLRLFGFCILTFFLGWRLAFAAFDGVEVIPPDATPGFAILALGVAFYKMDVLQNEIRSRRAVIRRELARLGILHLLDPKEPRP